MATNYRNALSLTQDGDSFTLDSANGYISCDEEGWYAIHLDGTLGASTTVTPYIRFQGGSNWNQLDVPNTSNQTQFVMPTHGRYILVPGRVELKFVVASFTGSSDLLARRTKVAR